MSISLAIEFQQNLHKLMEKNGELKRLVSNIYQFLKPDLKYPYILQQVNKIELLKTAVIESYEIKGEINLYIRDNTFNNFKNIISKIEQIFAKQDNILASYNYISGRITEGEFSPSQDLLTTRLKLTYFVLIQRRA